MVTTMPRLLLPQLPPELRNEIYNYLSTYDAYKTPTAQFLPFQLKQYECKHTSITITPVHYGSNGLLALHDHRFLEAHEYCTWLKNNALEIRISVMFKGKVNTFVQADWDKKITSHLQKLVKHHDWLRKVARYDVQVHWNACDGVLKGRQKKPTGQIPRDMVKTLTGLMDGEVKKKHGCVKMKLLLAHRIAVEHVLSGTSFGLAVFLAQSVDDGSKETIIEAWKTAHRAVAREADIALNSAPFQEMRRKCSALEGGSGNGVEGAGHLLMKKTYSTTDMLKMAWEESRIGVGAELDYILVKLMEDCLAR